MYLQPAPSGALYGDKTLRLVLQRRRAGLVEVAESHVCAQIRFQRTACGASRRDCPCRCWCRQAGWRGITGKVCTLVTVGRRELPAMSPPVRENPSSVSPLQSSLYNEPKRCASSDGCDNKHRRMALLANSEGVVLEANIWAPRFFASQREGRSRCRPSIVSRCAKTPPASRSHRSGTPAT
jgi:hypothetical protein